MKAFRNLGGKVIETDVDLDLHGNPILPPDTTTNAKPAALDGHYVTVVGNDWVQIPITVNVVSFETKKSNAIEQINAYRKWYMDQPVLFNGKNFDGDEQARSRLVQALVIHRELGMLPPSWIAADNTKYTLNSIDDLNALATAVHDAFSSRFFSTEAIRSSIMAAADEAALNQIVIPKIPSF